MKRSEIGERVRYHTYLTHLTKKVITILKEGKIMTSEKQLIANQQNAQLSTGPVTLSGKNIVSSNAIKHGIFTKDLIVSSGVGQENEEEYREMLNNLISCLSPNNQIESLLVEKIAVDFWRLRRALRFESGSIRKCLEQIFEEFYSYGKQNNDEIEKEITNKKQSVEWNSSYIECLEKNEVFFDQPKWIGNDIESDLVDDFYFIARSVNNLTKVEREKLHSGDFDFSEIKALLMIHGYTDAKMISTKLIELYSDENQRIEREILELENKKIINATADKLNCTLGIIPYDDNTDKILKYERSLQKSIFQNLFLLKKLQGLC
jgi:hypothetical protein